MIGKLPARFDVIRLLATARAGSTSEAKAELLGSAISITGPSSTGLVPIRHWNPKSATGVPIITVFPVLCIPGGKLT